MIINSCCFIKLHWSQSPFTFFAKWSQFPYKSLATNARNVNSQILCCCCCFSVYFRGWTVVDRWLFLYFYGNDCQFAFLSMGYLPSLILDFTKGQCSSVTCQVGNVQAVWLLSPSGAIRPWSWCAQWAPQEKCRKVSLTDYKTCSSAEKNIYSEKINSSWELI